jgi:hypothetical protein
MQNAEVSFPNKLGTIILSEAQDHFSSAARASRSFASLGMTILLGQDWGRAES